MCKISVVIPCYRSGDYIDACFESLINQTLSDAEFIFINDGDENLVDKLDDFKQRDSRVRVVHKDNGGCSSARNVGLDIATGDWVTFVDSDDELDANYLDGLYQGARKDIDIVFCGHKKVFTKNRAIAKEVTFKIKEKNKVCSMREVYEILSYEQFAKTTGKLIRRDIVERNKFRFDENLACEEDFLFYLSLYKVISKAYLVESYGYHYMIRGENSIQDTYKENYLSILLKRKTVFMELIRTFGYTKEEMERERAKSIFSVYSFFAYNLFLPKTPYTFAKAKEEVEKVIIKNNECVKALLAYKTNGLYEKIFCCAVWTRSSFIVACVLKLWHTISRSKFLKVTRSIIG